ncbi:hypothetical protein BZARG_2200 [Bizionia argentinensis JUB59]|uniref:Uncharacterized protein n=1 Tax=Bizionia argentinensis JUB59 TaxID=1046627 RepID=G2EG92_9FLAO|nr:winged helix-turn-helix domain-containing protein [Bizionia argentinensis]EGV42498.1 hypothetical protein BZARG_2200 [Bizionia argentinensis JUB59]
MIKREEILMLNLIEDSGNVKRLLRENLSYKEISELISKLVQDELLTYVDKKIILTDKGEKKLNESKHLIKETNKELWIKPENKSRVKKIERNFIYLPNQTELDF